MKYGKFICLIILPNTKFITCNFKIKNISLHKSNTNVLNEANYRDNMLEEALIGIDRTCNDLKVITHGLYQNRQIEDLGRNEDLSINKKVITHTRTTSKKNIRYF